MPGRVTVTPEDHFAGSPGAPVVLVEYGDYACRRCEQARAQVRRLQQLLGERLCVVFRHFPLEPLHPRAELAAEAAEAAGAQGRFWEMHHLLLSHQEDLSLRALQAHARRLGLDVAAFLRSVREHRFQERIRHDFLSGARSGVSSTPAFFINGLPHAGAPTTEALLEAITGSAAPAP